MKYSVNSFSSQVGVLSLKYPMVSFQEQSDTAYERLLTLVQELLPSDSKLSKEEKNKENEKTKNMSFVVSMKEYTLVL